MHTKKFKHLLLMGVPVAATTFAIQAHAQQNSDSPTEVLVTATHLERRPEDIAGTVTVVGDEQIRDMVANNLADVVRYQPGLGMDSATRGGDEGFRIRGIGGNRVLTVIDGVRGNDMYAAGPASYGKDSFEVDDLKAVEVIRGPASVLYGADALGGVVVLRTRDASDYLGSENRLYTAVRASSASVNSQSRIGATIAGQSGTLGSVLQLTRREFSEQEVKGEGQWNPQDGESQNVFWKTDWQAAAGHQLTLAIDANDETIETLLENELSSSVSLSTGEDTTERRRVSLSHDWQLESALADSVSTHLHWQRTDAEQFTRQLRTSYAFVNPRNPASFAGSQAERLTSFGFNQDTASAMLLAEKSWSSPGISHALVYGVSIERTDTERPRYRQDRQLSTGETSQAIPSYPMAPPELFPNKTFPDTETKRSGFFAQNEVSLMAGRLTVIPGLRYDRYEMTPRPDTLFVGADSITNGSGEFQVRAFDQDKVSANLGVIFDINDGYSVFAQYAEGFRPPNFDEANQAFVNLGHSYATLPNPNLSAETSQGFEAGIRGRVSKGQFTVSVFDNHYDDFIESSLVGTADGVMLFQSDNIGRARIYGLETSLDWQLSDALSWRNAVSLSRGRDKISERELNSVDPMTWVTGLRYQTSARWSAEAIATLTADKNHVAEPGQITGDAYQVVDLLGHYQLSSNAELRFGVFNVLDEQYAPWSRIRGLQASDNEAVANSQAPGINARLALAWHF
ncbi:MAG: TonB-dependent hemoglobin/transferrin/lactoferrin family receptor [Pseudomonadota bacterium]|nr:TonB-dependent hemoglobin/transferrin/lactoferrin family receptor [Pseudomonadota bacterium]